MEQKADVMLRNEGTVWGFLPVSEAGKAWIDENVQAAPWQWLGGMLVVDHRYWHDLAQGMLDAGLKLEKM